MGELIKIIPDKEKAKSILMMVNADLEMLNILNISKFPSQVTKGYYDVLRELISIILLLDGYKVSGEGAHKRMIEYLSQNCNNFNLQETTLIDNLRIVRNKIAYDGYFVKESYIKRIINDIILLIDKLKKQVNHKLK